MSLGLTTAQLTLMRAQVEQLLPDTAIIQAPTNTPDSMGGISVSYTAVAGGTVSCRLDPTTKATQLQVYQARETLTKMYQLTMPYDAPLATDYRVVINSQNYHVVQLDT